MPKNEELTLDAGLDAEFGSPEAVGDREAIKRPQSVDEGIIAAIPCKASLLVLVIGTVALLVAGFIAGEPDRQVCAGDKCLNSYSYLVIWITLVVLLSLVNDAPPDLVLLFATVVLSVVPGSDGKPLITPEQAWKGFSQPSILAIAGLFVFARAVEETRAVEILVRPVLGMPSSHVEAVLRLCLPTAVFSAFLNNTPIVAMLLSVCETWSARASLDISVLLMPLSFASILGGLCTLIGTSTNLVLNSQIEADTDPPCAAFGFFTMSPAALPAVLAGIIVLSILAPRLLGAPSSGTTRPATDESAAGGGATSGGPTGGDGAANGGGRGDVALGGSALPPPSVAAWAAPTRNAMRGYEIDVAVLPGCELLGETVEALTRLVAGTAPNRASSAPSPRSPQHPSDENGETELKTAADGSSSSLPVDVSSSAAAPTRDAAPLLAVLAVLPSDETAPLTPQCEEWDTRKLEVGDALRLSCAAPAVPRLRRVKGLRATPEAASEALGAKRRHRCLHEAVLAATSPLVGRDVVAAAAHPLLDHTAIWGLRRSRPTQQHHHHRPGMSTMATVGNGPRSMMGMSMGNGPRSVMARASYGTELLTPDRLSGGGGHGGGGESVMASVSAGQEDAGGRGGVALLTADSAAAHISTPFNTSTLLGPIDTEPLRAGDTLLLEADEHFSDSHSCDPDYALLSIVPASMPPRESTRKDTMRLVASLGCLVALLALSATSTVALLPLSLLLAFFLVAIKGLTPDQAWRAINYRVLLTICCSFGLGSALSNTHVSDILASALKPIGVHGGGLLFLLAIFFLTSALSCIVSNSATVVLLYHVLRLVRVPSLHPAQPLLALMLGASCAFATPIGYQTNLMVLTRGGYKFGDFGLLGGTLTLAVGFTACVFIRILPESMLPESKLPPLQPPSAPPAPHSLPLESW